MNEQPTEERSEFDTEEHEQPEMALEPQTTVVERPRPLTAAAPKLDPPLSPRRDTVRVQVGRDGYAEIGGQRVFVARNLAGATVNVERPL